MDGSGGVAAGQGHPDRHFESQPQGRKQQQAITEEEAALYKRCSNEAFVKRSLPMMFLASMYLVTQVRRGKTEFKGPGNIFAKGLALNAFAYIAGNISYSSRCQQIFLEELPDSNTSRRIRRMREKRQGHGTPDSEQEQIVFHESQQSQQRYPSEYNPSDSYQGELRENQPLQQRYPSEYNPADRDRFDSRVGGDNLEAHQSKQRNSYEELRRQNRLEYEKKIASRYDPLRGQQTQEPPEFQPPQSSSRQQPEFFADKSQPPRREKRNKYGDVVFDDDR